MSVLITRAVPLVLPAGILLLFGLATLYSADRHMGGDEFFKSQIQWCGAAVLAGVLAAAIPYRFLVRRAWFFYGLGVLLLVLVRLVGVRIYGSQRWLNLAGFSLQPSEVMKPAFILVLAQYLRYRRDLERWRTLMIPGVLSAVPFALIFTQPDLGTSLLFLPVGFAMLFAAGASARKLLLIVLVGLVLAGLAHTFVLEPYQKERILSTVFRHRLTAAERQREGYQLEQALRSVGIGGWLGEGYLNGTQNRLSKLPFRHNDFIFAVAAEEFGFAGASLVLLLYAGLLVAIFSTAVSTRDPAGRLVVVGVGVFLGTQIIVHIGVNLGLVPTKGMTLPLFSHGGTALLTTFILLGLVLNVAFRRSPVVSGDADREQLARLRLGR